MQRYLLLPTFVNENSISLFLRDEISYREIYLILFVSCNDHRYSQQIYLYTIYFLIFIAIFQTRLCKIKTVGDPPSVVHKE